MNATSIIKGAIALTKETEPDHWERTIRSRAGAEEGHAGSYFPRRTAEQVEKLIEELVWEPYTHAAVQEPARAFIARSFPGLRFGMSQTSLLPENARLRFAEAKKAKDEPDQVELIWDNPPEDLAKGIECDFIVALVGPGDEGDIIWTLHPGDPIKPHTIDRYTGGNDRLTQGPCNKHIAAELGFKWVKIGG